MGVNKDDDGVGEGGKPVVTNSGRELGTARGLTRETEGWDAAMTDEEVDEFLGTEIVW